MCTKLLCQEFIITIPFRKTGFYVCHIEWNGSPVGIVKFMAGTSAGLWPDILKKKKYFPSDKYSITNLKYKYNIFRKDAFLKMPQNAHSITKVTTGGCMWAICNVPAFYFIAFFAVLCWPWMLWQAFETYFWLNYS